MRINKVKIDQLANDPANVRTHDERNLDAIRASLQRFGQQKPIVVDGDGIVIAGNGTLNAAKSLGWKDIEVVRTELTGAEAVAFAIADNRTAELAKWHEEDLARTLESLRLDDSIDELVTGYTDQEIEDLIGKRVGLQEIIQDDIPEPSKNTISKLGDVWRLGQHMLICGDTTDIKNLEQVVGKNEYLRMIHADPPYGMGKEKDGVLNDNLYRDKLDKFQMQWWATWRKMLAHNGSVYIWGNAEDLWRLWYLGGLSSVEKNIAVRNEIVWDKVSGMGMNSEMMHTYSTATERCLFIMLGQQFIGNQNTDDFWEGFEPIRSWLDDQVKAEGWTKKKVNDITKTHMAGHWLTKCQFQIMQEKFYNLLKEESTGKGFVLSYQEFTDKFVGEDQRNRFKNLNAEMKAKRSVFNNTHDIMRDVWNYMRVSGEERFGHATPKPVEMVARAIKTSSNEGDLIGVPFGGTCPEIIACEQLDRKCVAMELEPAYCDVIVERWQQFTGKDAERI